MEELILTLVSRRIRVHHGKEAWQQAAGMREEWEAESSYPQSQAQAERESEISRVRVCNLNDCLARPHHLNLPKQCHQVEAKC